MAKHDNGQNENDNDPFAGRISDRKRKVIDALDADNLRAHISLGRASPHANHLAYVRHKLDQITQAKPTTTPPREASRTRQLKNGEVGMAMIMTTDEERRAERALEIAEKANELSATANAISKMAMEKAGKRDRVAIWLSSGALLTAIASAAVATVALLK